jgi:SWI/SNF-related matrix-associated actin-dependent regulator 1 of chromatin subfamily A
MARIRSIERPDWYIWNAPDPSWCRQYATVPGLQWSSNGEQITFVQLHRSHLTIVPSDVLAGLELPDMCHYAQDIPGNLAARGINLRGYQAEDLPFLTSRRGSLLAYEMRLGKTLTACAAHDPRDGMLVVCGPLASRDVWRNWIEQVHGFTPIILQGTKNVQLMEGFPAYFIHYEVLDAHTKFFTSQRIATLILDEIHVLQNPKARRTSATNVLAPRAERIIGLSGTPMWNRPISFYPILHMVTPGAWGGRHAYAAQYCDAQPTSHGWSYTGQSNPEELAERLREVMCRRSWQDVLGHLPPVTRVVEPVEVSNSKLAELESAAIRAALARGTNNVAGYLATLRRKLAEVKVVPTVELATQAMTDGHKVLAWYWHNEVGDKIQAAVEAAAPGKVYRYSAAMSATEREDSLGRFRAHVGPATMVIGMAVGGVALDASCADYAIMAELDWIPANVQQAEMRTFHPSRPHIVVYLYADVGVERKLIEALSVREGFQSALGLTGEHIARFVLDGATAATVSAGLTI